MRLPTQVLESGSVGGVGGRQRAKTNKKTKMSLQALSFDFWLTSASQVNNAAAHLVSLSIIGAYFSENPLPLLRCLPVIRGQSDASACIIKRFVCGYVPVVAHPRVLYSERRGLISTTKSGRKKKERWAERNSQANRGRQQSRENKRQVPQYRQCDVGTVAGT